MIAEPCGPIFLPNKPAVKEPISGKKTRIKYMKINFFGIMRFEHMNARTKNESLTNLAISQKFNSNFIIRI